MNKIKQLIIASMLVLGIGLVATPVYATCATAAECADQGLKATGSTGGKADIGEIVKDIVNALLFILGAVAVIMIVIGGIRYTISQGDSGAVTSAKNTILYSVIGLVVALFAYAIVNFVITRLTEEPPEDTTARVNNYSKIWYI